LESDDLSAKEIFQIAACLDCGEAVVVGGQALNIWAELFSSRVPDLESYRPFTSKDFDYLGYVSAARKLAEKLGGTLKIPSLEDMTPSTALVEADIVGRKIIIDFIGNVLGVQQKRLEDSTVELRVPFVFDGSNHELTLLIIHPVHCLQARAANVMHPMMNRRDDASLRQLRAAVIVVSAYILDRLQNGDHKEATWSVKELSRWLRHQHARAIYEELKIDPLEILRIVSEAPEWDARFVAKTLRPLIEAMEARRG
jgi:hypothetical protein